MIESIVSGVGKYTSALHNRCVNVWVGAGGAGRGVINFFNNNSNYHIPQQHKNTMKAGLGLYPALSPAPRIVLCSKQGYNKQLLSNYIN